MASSSSSTVNSLPDGFKFRPLEKSDYKQYVELLSQLTTTGDMNESLFNTIFDEFNKFDMIYNVWVVEDEKNKKLAAATTLFVERKVIHGGSYVGHIEDVVTNTEYRGKGIGRALV